MSSEIKGIGGASIHPPRLGESMRGSAPKGSGAASDRISLTDTAMSLGNIEHTLAQIPVVDGQRVDSVRESIADGTYEFDPVSVANHLIDFEMMLDRAGPYETNF